MKTRKSKFTVVFYPTGRALSRNIYQGSSETVMYSHVSAMEWVLQASYGTGEIEITEDGRPRSIEYRDGRRCDIQADPSMYEWLEGRE